MTPLRSVLVNEETATGELDTRDMVLACTSNPTSVLSNLHLSDVAIRKASMAISR